MHALIVNNSLKIGNISIPVVTDTRVPENRWFLVADYDRLFHEDIIEDILEGEERGLQRFDGAGRRSNVAYRLR